MSFKGQDKKKSIINIGSFDLIEREDLDLAQELLKALSIDISNINIEKYIDKKRISSKVLWEYLGFEEILFIDADAAHKSLVYDLNFDLEDKYNFKNTFDVVANFGTTEHIFNQHSAFQNIHKLCKTNGLMIHSLPIQGAYEHGLYNYHPNFFWALSAVNNYKIEYFGVRHKDLQNYELVDIKNTVVNVFLKSINANDTFGAFVILRKLNDSKFKIPFQGRYEHYKYK